MLNIRTILLAEDVVRDTVTNTVSVFKLIEQITAEGYPINIPKAWLYILVDRQESDNSEQKLNIKFSHNKRLIEQATVNISFKGQNAARVMVNLGALEFPEPGDAQFAVYDEQELLLKEYLVNLSVRDTSAMPV